MVIDRRKERLDSLVAEIEAAGGRALAIVMDVTDSESVFHAGLSPTRMTHTTLKASPLAFHLNVRFATFVPFSNVILGSLNLSLEACQKKLPTFL